MRCVLLFLTASLITAVESSSAPLTQTSSTATGPTNGERTTKASVSVDDAWAKARQQAENEAQLRHDQAAKASNAALNLRGPITDSEPILAGGLANIAGDEIAMLLELQRRRRNANPDHRNGNVVAEELAAVLTDTRGHLPGADETPAPAQPTDHPTDEPHAVPQPPKPTGLSDRPEHFPGNP